MNRFALSVITVLAFSSLSWSSDWPQWLGPNRDAVATESIRFTKDVPQPAWKKAVGEGHSSPVVAHGLVFLHTKVADKNVEQVAAYDAKTGDAKWIKTYDKDAYTSPFGNGPRATPCVSDDYLYTFGNTGVLICWEAKTGKEVWKVDTLKEFKAPNLTFGISCSPIVVEDNVIVQVGSKGAGLVAFDKKTGKVAWKALDDAASYASAVERDGQLLVLTAAHLVSLNPKTGDVNWKEPFKDALNESSTTPVQLGDYIFASSVTAGAVCMKLGKDDSKPTAKREWKQAELSCYFSTPVAVDKTHLYMVTGALSLKPSATLRCVDITTGKTIWTQKDVGKYHASLMRLSDGHLLMLDDSGNLSLLAPDIETFKELAKIKICGGNGDTWAHPALAEGRLYVRDSKELICLPFKN